MGNVGDQIVAIATAIIGVALISVIVSKRSDTANVITQATNAFSSAIGQAVAPVTGAGGGFTQSLNFAPQTIGGF